MRKEGMFACFQSQALVLQQFFRYRRSGFAGLQSMTSRGHRIRHVALRADALGIPARRGEH